MDNEIWKVYKESLNNRWGKRVYEVSNLGRVRINGVEIQPGYHNQYYAIGCFKIHRAVAELFVPNPDNKPFVDHIDTNPLNNRADNLRWCTLKENSNNPLTRVHCAVAKKGNTYRKAHYHSEESKQKNRESHIGRKHSTETKNKMSKSHKEYCRLKRMNTMNESTISST